MSRFEGKVAIVTGASRGLGAQYSRDFAAEGAQVIGIGRNRSNLESVAEEIRSRGGKFDLYQLDITDYDGINKMADEVARKYGAIDILVNNAAFHRSVKVARMSREDWEQQINVNLNGTFYCTRAVLPYMLEKKYGKIVNIASSAARVFFPGFGAYGAAKGGMISFTNILQEEVKFDNINVNAIYLGMTNTEYTRERLGDDEAITIDLDDMLQPPEVSKVVLWLASDEAAPLKGAAIDVFGNHY